MTVELKQFICNIATVIRDRERSFLAKDLLWLLFYAIILIDIYSQLS
jgi:hypothetical protein